MTILFIILVVLASFLLGFVVLVQNPKGGGLSGSIGGISTQYMGVKQTTDVLEKGTWIFAAVIGLLCLFSTLFISGNSSSGNELEIPTEKTKTAPVKTTAPKTTAPTTTPVPNQAP
jgi:preprotein translocase subunit SecG